MARVVLTPSEWRSHQEVVSMLQDSLPTQVLSTLVVSMSKSAMSPQRHVILAHVVQHRVISEERHLLQVD